MRPKLSRILARGLRQRCPHCARSPLFARWFTLHERCGSCGLRFEQSPGDTWALWILGDRLFVAAAIVLIFFVFRPRGMLAGGSLLLAIGVPLVLTMPHRMGVCVAFDYFTRVLWGESSEVPAPLEGEPPAP